MVKVSWPGGALLLGLLAGCASTARQAEQVRDFSGFDVITTPAPGAEPVWVMRPDGVIAVAGKPSGYIVSRESYANYRLHAEWRWPGKPGNAGVLLHVASGPKDNVWPLSVQVQTKHGFAGDVLPMAGASFAEPLTTAPGAYPAIKGHTGADSEKPVGEWNSVDVVSRDGVVEVSVNGVAQNRISGASPGKGPIGFQLEGTPYELRNVRIEPIE
jgi:hypothetical protein